VLAPTAWVVADNASGAGNQQERPSIDSIPSDLGSFLSGFALGEGSFMVVCRPRADYPGKWKISAAFNVSQRDPEPLRLFRDAIGCGTMRQAGNQGWYLEVNRLTDLSEVVVPFFERFPLVGTKAESFREFSAAVRIMAQNPRDSDWIPRVLAHRERMNDGGKRRYTMEGILRDYTPNPRTEG
jgi:hypothetical protein